MCEKNNWTEFMESQHGCIVLLTHFERRENHGYTTLIFTSKKAIKFIWWHWLQKRWSQVRGYLTVRGLLSDFHSFWRERLHACSLQPSASSQHPASWCQGNTIWTSEWKQDMSILAMLQGRHVSGLSMLKIKTADTDISSVILFGF